MEACYTEGVVAPINMNDDNQYYYGGPGVYCVVRNNRFYNVFDNDFLDDETTQEILATESRARNYEIQNASVLQAGKNISSRNAAGTNGLVSYNVEYDYFSDLVEHGTNEQGTCTVIATAMLLGYYNYFGNTKFVQDQYENGSGTNEAFH